MPLKSFASIGALAVAATCSSATSARADTVVQFSIDALLNARPVSTLTNGSVVTWTATQGVDGNGSGDGYITKAVLMKLGQTGNALPDDGIFPAANGIPEIDLHFSNDSPATSFQAHNAHSGVAASIDFAVPQATYSKVFLVLTSAEGSDKLTVTLTYADATTSKAAFTLSDYDTPVPANTADVSYFSLISMHKWSPSNQLGDNAGHQITGVSLVPAPTKPLTRITIAKPADGQYVVFWGATGIATSPIDAGAPTGGVDAGAADAAAETTTGATNDGGGAGAVDSSGGGGGANGSAGGASGGGIGGGVGGSSGGAGSAAGTNGIGTGGASGAAGGAGIEPISSGRSSSSGCSLSASAGADASLSTVLLALCAIVLAAARVRATRSFKENDAGTAIEAVADARQEGSAASAPSSSPRAWESPAFSQAPMPRS